MGESSTVANVGARSRLRAGLAFGEGAALGPSGTDTSSLPATLLVSDCVLDPKMLLKAATRPQLLHLLLFQAVGGLVSMTEGVGGERETGSQGGLWPH